MKKLARGDSALLGLRKNAIRANMRDDLIAGGDFRNAEKSSCDFFSMFQTESFPSCLSPMLSGANAFEISGIQGYKIKPVLTIRM